VPASEGNNSHSTNIHSNATPAKAKLEYAAFVSVANHCLIPIKIKTTKDKPQPAAISLIATSPSNNLTSAHTNSGTSATQVFNRNRNALNRGLPLVESEVMAPAAVLGCRFENHINTKQQNPQKENIKNKVDEYRSPELGWGCIS
jgi:hypothetical protein